MNRCSFDKKSYGVISPNNKNEIEKLTPSYFDYDANLEVALAEIGTVEFRSPTIYYGMENLIDCISNNIYPNLFTPEKQEALKLPEYYPHLYERVDAPEPMSPLELGDFLDNTHYNNTEDLNKYIKENPVMVAQDFNNYYYKQYGGNSSNSLCSMLSNPFINAVGLIENIIKNSDNPLQFLPEPAQKLKSFAEQTKSSIESLFKELNNSVDGITKMANQATQNITNPNVINGLSSLFTKRDSSLRNMLSKSNEEDMKLSVDRMVTNAATQFKKLIENPQIILHLLFMFCKIQSSIESRLREPVDSYREIVKRVDTQRNMLKIQSSYNTRVAVENGRVAVDEVVMRQKTKQAAQAHNNAIEQNQPALSEYQTQMTFTPQYSSHPDPNSWSNLTFESQVTNNQKVARIARTSPDIGYRGANLQLLEKLNEVGKMLGRKLTVNSAYRHPLYNKSIGGAKKSAHMRGIAFDVKQGRDRQERAKYVAMCKRAGFNGFGYYPSFIHADTAGVRSWVGSGWGGKY